MPLACSWAWVRRICSWGQHCAHTGRSYARHGIEFSNVVDKVHLVYADSGYTHGELGGNVEDGEQHDRDVVGQELADAPVMLEEHGPAAKLEIFVRDVDSTR